MTPLQRLANTALVVSMPAIAALAQSGYWSDLGNRDTSWPDAAHTFENNTLFTVDTPQQLAQFAYMVTQAENLFQGQTVMLNTNINLSGHDWAPVGRVNGTNEGKHWFRGTFDGNGRAISNMRIHNRPIENTFHGFFSVLQGHAVVRNLRLEAVDIDLLGGTTQMRAGCVAGAIVGQNGDPAGVTIENCDVTSGLIYIEPNGVGFVGALVGDMAYKTFYDSSNPCVLRNCSNQIEVRINAHGAPTIGGLVGQSRNILMANNLNSGPVNVLNQTGIMLGSCDVGGVSGNANLQTVFRNCLNTGPLSFDPNQYTTPRHGGIAALFHGTSSANPVYFLGANSTAPISHNRAFFTTGYEAYAYPIINLGPGLLSPKLNYNTNSPVAALNAWVAENNQNEGADIYRPWILIAGANNDYPVLEPPVDIWATFDYNGADGGVTWPAKQVTTGLVYGQLPVPTRAGCDFAGWFAALDGTGPEAAFGSPVTLASNHTLHAKWTMDVAFNGNGGQPALTNLTQTVGFGFILPEPHWEGHAFAGWFENPDGTGAQATSLTPVAAGSPALWHAKWLAPIVFNGNGGDPAATNIPRVVGAGYLLPAPPPFLEGCDFAGWFTHPDGTGLEITNDAPVTATSPRELFAAWTFPVVFDANGGASSTNIIQTLNTGFVVPVDDPVYEGFDFAGWFASPDGTGTHVTNNAPVTAASPRVFHAAWTFPVVFYGNGGIPVVTNITQTLNADFVVPPMNFYYTTFIFAGWHSNPDGTGTHVTNGAPVTAASPQELYAAWAFPVVFNANGGAPSAKIFQTVGQNFILPDPGPAFADFTFDGWHTNPDGTGARVTTATPAALDSPRILHAKWDFIVAFDPNDNLSSATNITQTVGQNFILPAPDPAFSNFTFTGWCTHPDGTGTHVTNNAPATAASPRLLHAVWTFTSCFDGNRGDPAVIHVTQTIGARFVVPSDEPVFEGYAFAGWFANADGSGMEIIEGTLVTVASPRVFHAKWTVAVTFSGNGGAPAATNVTQTLHAPFALPAPAPVYETHVFAGWFTHPDGTGLEITNNTFAEDSPRLLHAKWTFPVVFCGNAGTPATTQTLQTLHAPFVLPEPGPVLENFAFGGWFTHPGGTGLEITNIIATATSPRLLHAKWTTEIVFNGNHGEPASQRVPQTLWTPLNLPAATPARKGFVFDGWRAAPGGTGAAITGATLFTLEIPLELHAKWNLREGVLLLDLGGSPIVFIIPPGIIIIPFSVDDPYTGVIRLPGLDGVIHTGDDILVEDGTCDPDSLFTTVNSGSVTDRHGDPLAGIHGEPVPVPPGSVITPDGVVFIFDDPGVSPSLPADPSSPFPLPGNTRVWVYIPPLASVIEPTPPGTVYDPILFALLIPGEEPVPIPDTLAVPLITRVELIEDNNIPCVWIQAAGCDSRRMWYTVVDSETPAGPYAEADGVRRHNQNEVHPPLEMLDFVFPMPGANARFYRVKAVVGPNKTP